MDDGVDMDGQGHQGHNRQCDDESWKPAFERSEVTAGDGSD